MNSILNTVLGRSPANTAPLSSEKNNKVTGTGDLAEDHGGEAVQEIEDAFHEKDDDMSLVLQFAGKDVHDPDTILMQ